MNERRKPEYPEKTPGDELQTGRENPWRRAFNIDTPVATLSGVKESALGPVGPLSTCCA